MKSVDRGCRLRLRCGRRWPVRMRPRIRPLRGYCAPRKAGVRACSVPVRQIAAFLTAVWAIDWRARDRGSSGNTPYWVGNTSLLERRIERAMEMADRALETPELEEVVRAALESLLNPTCDCSVLGGS